MQHCKSNLNLNKECKISNKASTPKTNSQSSKSNSAQVNFTTVMHKNTVQVSINACKTNALCDTGASISCISKAFLQKSCGEVDLHASHIRSIVGVGGEQHCVDGMVNLTLSFSGLRVSFPFHVVNNLHHTIILGVDFMERHNVKLDIANKTMSLHDTMICSLQCSTGYARTCAPVYIDPNCEVDIGVKVSRCQNGDQVLIEPVPGLEKYQIKCAKCVVKVRKGCAVIRILNPTDKVLTLKGNQIVGVVTPLVSNQVFAFGVNDKEFLSTEDTTLLCDTPNTSHKSSPKTSQEISDDELVFDFENSDLTPDQKEILLHFLKQNKDVFTTGLHNLGRTHVQTHTIDTGDAPPVRLPHYRQNPEIRRETERQVKEMLAHKIIEPSNSAWHSPVVLVRKPNNEFRFAVDYRQLNKVTKPQSFPLPRLEDIFDAIGESNAKYFTSADISKAYWQVPLDEDAKMKSAFITYDGVYSWNYMPFGLMNAPATFQFLMSQIFRSINWRYVLCYIDDIVIFSETFELHLQHLAEVFQRLREAGLKLAPPKCYFAQKQIRYLGHTLSRHGVQPDSSKYERVKNLASPTNPTEVKSVLGLFNFYRKFISGYSKICAPLFALLQKDKPFIWTEDAQKSFETLKSALINAPILAYPNMNKPFTLTCDASLDGIGYILGQLGEDKRERVIAYGGRALRKAEKNYKITELECLAVVEGIREYRTYLSSGKFTVYTDHKALKYIHTIKNDSSRLARWSMELQEFNYEVQHRKGVNNQHADALSRLPFPSNSVPLKPSIPLDEGFPIAAATAKPEETKEWLKVSFEYASPQVHSIDTEDQTEQLPDLSQVHEDEVLPLIEHQKKCPELSPIYRYLVDKTLPDDDNLAKSVVFESNTYDIVEGVLVHHYQSRAKKLPVEERLVTQIALPKFYRLSALKAYHDEKGHFGIRKTFAALRDKYFWPRMYNEINNYVKSCNKCQFGKRDHNAHPLPLHPLPVSQLFGRMHIDIIGPLIKSTEGHEYILVVVDSFSRWVESFPLRTQTAEEIARVLHDEIFCRYGPPLQIVSDRGQNMLSKLVKAICELFQVTRHATSSYHPRANGCVEKQNGTITQILRMYVDKTHRNWHTILPFANMALRSTPNVETSGYSPYHILFGFEMRQPFDLQLIPRENLSGNAKQHVERVLEHLTTVRQLSADNSMEAKDKAKIRHDVKAKPSDFFPGETVLMKISKIDPDLSKKFGDKFSGPYYIRKVGPNDTYQLARCSDNVVLKTLVNAEKLKKYYDPDDHRAPPLIIEPAELHDNPDPILDQQPEENHPLGQDQERKRQEENNREQAPQKMKRNTVQGEETPQNNTQAAPKTQENTQEVWYECEKLLKTRGRGKNREFLVKWVGNHKPSWEPEENVSEFLIQQYFITHTKKGRSRKRQYQFFNRK